MLKTLEEVKQQYEELQARIDAGTINSQDKVCGVADLMIEMRQRRDTGQPFDMELFLKIVNLLVNME